MKGWGKGEGLSNANTVGMEIIAKDDTDVLPIQKQRFVEFMRKNYPDTPVFGHGEVNPGHKEATEGLTVAEAVRADRARRTVSAPGAFHPITGDVSDIPGFNIGNIRKKGGGWQKFDTPSDAAHAVVAQLGRYPKMFPKQKDVGTLSGAIKKYAPAGDRNKPAEYAKQVETWTGLLRNAQMNLSDPETQAKLAYGIARKEGHLGTLTLEDFRSMFIRHGAPLRRGFGHPHKDKDKN
jgi:hypothetical protein